MGWHFFMFYLLLLLCVANFDGHVQSQHAVTFPLGLWYVWPHVECEDKYRATCSLTNLFDMWGHCSPRQSIHVALNFFHVQLEIAT